MELSKARSIAEQLVTAIRPYCDRVEIGGSIRREQDEVGDIEIIVLPKRVPEPVPGDLFGGTRTVNLLHRWAVAKGEESATAAGIQWIKTSTSERIAWEPKEDGRYWRAYLQRWDINLDVFLAQAIGNFGMILLERTGSREFSAGVAMFARRVGMRLDDGWLWNGSMRLGTPEEIDVFKALNLAWVEPRDRYGVNDVSNAAPGTYESPAEGGAYRG